MFAPSTGGAVRLVELPRIFSHSGWYGHQAGQRDPVELVLAPGERITAVGAGVGDVLDTLVLRTDRGQELTAGNATRGHITFYDIPRGHEVVAINLWMNGV